LSISGLALHRIFAEQYAECLIGTRRDAIWLLLLSVAAKFADFVDEKLERSRPDNKI
jgi:hypothetical protein